MSTLVLHAHPLEESFSAVLRDVVCDALESSGVDHTLVRMAQGERPKLDGESTAHLVAVYPTWWSGPPAVMLNWLQRTLAPFIDGSEPVARSPFASVKRVTVVTTHGSSLLINRLQGQPGKCTWERVITPACAAGADFEWVALYKIDRSDEAERAAFVERVRAQFTTAAAPA